MVAQNNNYNFENIFNDYFYAEMSKISQSRIVSYRGTFLGNPIHISIEIECMFKATIVFTLFGMPYSFVIDSWQKREFRKFIEHFHSVATTRDAAKFGVMIEKEDGTKDFLGKLKECYPECRRKLHYGTECSSNDTRPKINIIQQGCEDIMACLNQLDQYIKDQFLSIAYGTEEIIVRRRTRAS